MNKAILILCGILITVIAVAGLGYDKEEFLFLNEIETGMRGTGKTVVANNEISEFAVEVLGVIDEPKTHSDFIVVRVSGEAIGRSGGISQGMSGSPIYVDGKLIGALSRAASWSKDITPIGLVTPIEDMLKLIDSEGEGMASSIPADRAVMKLRLVSLSAPPADYVLESNPQAIFSYPVSSPLLVSGLSERSLDVLMAGASLDALETPLLGQYLPALVTPTARGFSSFGFSLNPISGGGRGAFVGEEELEAGSAIGVGLAIGDIRIGALGTLTYRDGDDVVGFGHPLISNGKSEFPLAGAYVYDTMKAYDASFKLGVLGDPLGTILEDRWPGIGGVVGRSAQMIGLSLEVLDTDTMRGEDFEVNLVDEPRIMPELLLATGFEATDATLNRIGQGTVEVTYKIYGYGMPKTLERRDVFLSTMDIAVYAPWQLAGIVSILQYNDFQDPKISQIAASMEITEELKAMHINHLEIDEVVYTPGEMINYEVELQTFHGDVEVVKGQLEIPTDLASDYVVVRAYGGPRYLESGETPVEVQDLGELIELVEDLPSYDTLTVELFAPDPMLLYDEALQGIAEVETEMNGYFLYDEREVNALILLPG